MTLLPDVLYDGRCIGIHLVRVGIGVAAADRIDCVPAPSRDSLERLELLRADDGCDWPALALDQDRLLRPSDLAEQITEPGTSNI